MDERQLIAAARKGDIPAFEALVRRHHRTLYKFALGITRGNEHDAADILQDALIKAFLGIDRFEERSSFPSWLWRIIRNEFLDRIRAQRLETVSLDEEEAEGCEPGHHDTPEKQLSDEERKRHLLGLVAALPEKHSEIVILVELMELSYEDAAEYLAIPVGSVRSRLSRAREQLTESVKKNMELFSAVGRHTG
ncbi:MAG TPA: RNA polymerase sigma factor [bacterium]|nr:RNA polymerase sigma factor [bacterium]